MRESRDAETNPIVAGFYPDPTICRVGGDYYLAHSSFEYFPGAPLFHSRDLVTWTQVGHILDRRSQFRRGDARPSNGIYGSTLRHHDDRFWFATTNVSDYDAGQLIVHTTDPAGSWSEPVFVPEAVGIDPDLCWDDDGTCYLTWRSFATGEQGIRQAPLDLSTGRFTQPAYPVWQGSGLPAAEGPHLYHVGTYWYLVLAEGGTERGHCVTTARARSPRGPFEPCPENPIFSRRSTFHPVQSVGHADLVQTTDGSWAAVYLGVRPRGSTPGFHVLGRETFLAGIDWIDGWPVFDTGRYTVPPVEAGFVDDFAGDLHPRWVSPGDDPDLSCARLRDLAWSAEATLAGPGRFLVRLDDRHWYGLIFDGATVQARARTGDVEQELARVQVAGKTVVLRLASVPPTTAPVPLGHAGPDDIVLSLYDDSGNHDLARLDGRYLSTEVASGFTGRMLAVQPTTGPARVRSVRYTPQPI
jgi:hypothetical protein